MKRVDVCICCKVTVSERRQFLRTVDGAPSIPAQNDDGTDDASPCGVISADRFEDLLTWQLMYELSLGVWKFTGELPARNNFKLCDQIRDSSESAHRNVAEGFGRYNPARIRTVPGHIAGFSRRDAVPAQIGTRGTVLTDEEFSALDSLAISGLQALAKLQRYLRSPEAKHPND